jgi:MinD-like ATPase involved in chromosome partitioning or flagellar assembly
MEDIMAMITLLSAKGAPGVTTSAAALAYRWPGQVLVADCDPRGGSLATGWLARYLLNGWLRPDHGVVSFVTATRHDGDADPNKDILAKHAQAVPGTEHARLLVGLTDPAQLAAVDDDGWHRLATALYRLPQVTGRQVDVLVDCGQLGPSTPWSLIMAADLVLLVVRPTYRHLIAASPVAQVLRRRVSTQRLGMAMTGATTAGLVAARDVLRLPCGLALPNDPAAAAVFSDGVESSRAIDRSRLVKAAGQAAQHLSDTLYPRTLTHAATPARPMAGQPVGVRA